MQKFYRDKSKLFECNISVDGAKLNETKARLILEFPDKILLFHGKIKQNGKCEVVIPPLKEMEECEGNVLLEIIAESTYFESWRDNFKLETNKKVVVEMIENNSEIISERIMKPVVQIIKEADEVVENKTIPELNDFTNYLNENKIDYHKISKNKNDFINILIDYKKTNNLTKESILDLVKIIKENHKNIL